MSTRCFYQIIFGQVDDPRFFCRRGYFSLNHGVRRWEVQLPRVAFRLRIKAGREAEYDAAHRNVWPALLSKLKEVGISEYSIFRRDQDLFLVMQVDDFDAAWRALDNDPTNLRWQQEMGKLFEPVTGLKPGEKFAMMKEVFYME
ncbi:MAG: L-rhamnose mutarotase [Acidobacteria bacterium]|nr:MAG: L-rhamnose mutarotase [Acidobacteriota bacterium]PYT80765.1 MAG: L-rhamnose mutarotase [Acidobacteriota bacterium]